MESSSLCICCHGALNGLNTFKVKGQGHGEIDISFLIILHISTCWTYRNLPSSIFMFWVDEHSNKLVSFEVKGQGQGHGEIDMSFLIK
jgi:hypothetical protein